MPEKNPSRMIASWLMTNSPMSIF